MKNWRTMKIVAAACYKTAGNADGLTFSMPAPARHHDILQMMFRLGIVNDHTVEQGFLADTGDFVRRKPAYLIAERAGQLKRKQGPGTYQGDELFSEDVW